MYYILDISRIFIKKGFKAVFYSTKYIFFNGVLFQDELLFLLKKIFSELLSEAPATTNYNNIYLYRLINHLKKVKYLSLASSIIIVKYEFFLY